MPNRSLDDFAAADTDEEAAEDETEVIEAGDAETAPEPSDPDAEALATYRWTPWLDGDEYVCADCKNW